MTHHTSQGSYRNVHCLRLRIPTRGGCARQSDWARREWSETNTASDTLAIVRLGGVYTASLSVTSTTSDSITGVKPGQRYTVGMSDTNTANPSVPGTRPSTSTTVPLTVSSTESDTVAGSKTAETYSASMSETNAASPSISGVRPSTSTGGNFGGQLPELAAPEQITIQPNNFMAG